jgi:hypothetical protein
VQAELATQRVQHLTGRLAVTVDVHPPDRRRRDLDNALKALLDALEHGGAYRDDAQIDDLRVRRGVCVPGGCVWVRLRSWAPSDRDDEALAKPRTCLKCSQLFPSRGPGHRFCPPCSQKNAQLRLREAELQRQRGAKRHNGELLLPNGDGGLLG